MGLRGFAPKPTALKILEGNPGKRPLNKREPRPADSQVHCPASLSPDAQREWRRLAPVLRRMKVLTEADRIGLERLCEALVTQQQAQAALNKVGLLVKQGADDTHAGWIQTNPLFHMVRELNREIATWLREFGLTPAARTRVQVADGPERRKKDGVLNGQFIPDETFSRTPARATVLGEGGGKSSTILQ
jgi:P27 family predicted phage terminase small subunit